MEALCDNGDGTQASTQENLEVRELFGKPQKVCFSDLIPQFIHSSDDLWQLSDSLQHAELVLCAMFI